ncbi:F510_1955 family glycosylhydrolase [Fictibacillus sp. NRS-1165]|uniref:F510_1955 family glycosylhydrolase n=1 Tax=Fictibacillus sp. NRS-1165 TaxID=3144463 RepID=UPI003D22E81F
MKNNTRTITHNRFSTFIWILLLTLLIAGICIYFLSKKGSDVSFEDIHGIGYTKKGNEILIPAHDGIKEFSAGEWKDAPGEKNDYMGFAMVNDGFYSSGHPATGSSKPNPLGIIRSSDKGKSVNTLDLEGESDFHLFAAGFNNHALYAYTPQPNSKMDSAGLYYSLDGAKSWKKSNMTGVDDEPTGLAVHPDKNSVVSVSTKDTVLISNDFGKTFKVLYSKPQITALSFTFNNSLLVGGFEVKATLSEINLKNESTKQIKVPSMSEDAIAFIAQNPSRSQEYAFATYKKDVYKGTEHDWKQIVKSGNSTTVK